MIVYTNCAFREDQRVVQCRIDMAENPEVRKDEPHCFFADPDEMKEGPTPPPTDAPPGSQAKLDVLQWRAQHGYALWNPEDATA